MKTIIKVLSLAVLVGIVSCKHDESLTEPTLQDTYGAFGVVDSLSINKTTVAFGSGETVTFGAKFTIRAKWQLSIKGKKSKVTKTITGTSKVLDATNAIWDGSSDVPYFPADTAIVTLSFPDDTTKPKMVRMIHVTSPRKFGNNPNYILVKDFSKGSINFNNDGPKATPNCSVAKLDSFVLGGVYYRVEGMEDNPTSYYMGGMTFTAGESNPGKTFFPIVQPGVTPDDEVSKSIYFNLWVHGYSDANTKISVQFNEVDAGHTAHVPSKDDIWEYVIIDDFNGWKQISFNMTEPIVVPATVPLYGGSGNKKREIDRIASITINISTVNSVTGKTIKTALTYATFSIGSPFHY